MDLSPAMLSRAYLRARDQGIADVEFVVSHIDSAGLTIDFIERSGPLLYFTAGR